MQAIPMSPSPSPAGKGVSPLHKLGSIKGSLECLFSPFSHTPQSAQATFDFDAFESFETLTQLEWEIPHTELHYDRMVGKGSFGQCRFERLLYGCLSVMVAFDVRRGV